MDQNVRALRESREHIAIERDMLREQLNLIRAERDRYREALGEIEDRLLLNGGCFARRLVGIARQALEGDKGK